MNLSKARRISEALGSWLHLEACCFRAGLFSESSFKSAIGNVVSSLQSSHRAARVRADYPLAAIQKVPDSEKSTGGGRKRSVDFALIYDDGREPASEPDLLIEAKWAPSSHCTAANITADFIRLALMKRAHPNAVCIFVLAGPREDLAKALSRPPFHEEAHKRDAIGISTNMRRFAFRAQSAKHQKQYGAAINAFVGANLLVPTGFTATGTDCYPPQSPGKTVKFQAIAWEVHYVPITNVKPTEWPVPPKNTKRRREQDEIA